VVVLLVAGLPAFGAESQAVTSPRATVSLVSQADAVAPGGGVRLGLRFRLSPGWHIYWTNPGDAGTAPDLSLELSPGAQAGGIDWPAPDRLAQGPVVSFGYQGEVVLPFSVTAPGPGLTVLAKASWLVCREDCIPEEGTFRLALPAGPPRPSPEAPLFSAAEARRPGPSPFVATIAADGRLTLIGQGLSAKTVRDAWFFPTVWGVIDQSATQRAAVSDGRLTLALAPGPAFDAGRSVEGVLALESLDGQQRFVSVAAAPEGAVLDAAAVLSAIGLAFLGGAILNLMPCVFPILAMKALAVAGLSGAAQRSARRQAGAYLVGVLLAFAVLAGVTLAARGVGQQLGWGGQFQSPAFVAAMVWLLLAIGLNLSGLYTLGSGLVGVGAGLATRDGWVGNLFTGLLAVVVATPCTAPFMGAAVATALAQPAPILVAIFLALGLGFGLPFALLALVPPLLGWLPRPGQWMDLLRQALAFPLYGAAAWLAWVVGNQAGPQGVAIVAGGAVLAAFACWCFGTGQRLSRRGRVVTVLLAVAALAGDFALLPVLTPMPLASQVAAPSGEVFSAARLNALREEGHPVFVNMTADWCVVCLVNERVVLGTKTVRDLFARRGISYLKGDWTRRDPDVTAFLAAHGRDGVPLYVFFPAGGRQPAILPQILTEATVIEQTAAN
jgi:thiol:disulfide interchange protein DsbD